LITRAALLLLTSATPALADVPLLTLALPGETLTIPQGAPVAAEVTVNANGQPAVYVKLAPPDATRFAEMTERHVGQIATISLCGTTVSEPILQTPISGGALVIWGDPTAQTADQIVARLTSGSCDAP
jgi:preprotein translocase subunit SecD